MLFIYEKIHFYDKINNNTTLMYKKYCMECGNKFSVLTTINTIRAFFTIKIYISYKCIDLYQN